MPQFSDGFPDFSCGVFDSPESYPPDYFEKLSKIEDASFWFTSRNALILYALQRYFPTLNNFIEIGCGTGFVLSAIRREFPAAALSGSDIHRSGLHFASSRVSGAELFIMDARSIPFEDEFDVVGAFDMLEHVNEDMLVLAGIRRALHSGGGLVLTVPQHQFLWSAADEKARHARRYEMKELACKVNRCGFEILRMTSFVSLLLPLMLVSRLKNRYNKTFDVMDELTMNRGLNAVLEKLMDLERALIRGGVDFRCGGSLLLIARKR